VWAAHQRWQIKPKYIFLWGKAAAFFRNPQGTASAWARVPTWGYPCSDILLVSNYKPNELQNEPLIPIGRINILNDAEGEAYLEKIKQYESSPFEPWMKHGLQLGGGTNATEQSGIRNFMLTAKNIYETGTFSGRSFYFQKTNNDVISADTSVVVSQLINSGVNIVYIFGHSNANVYDVEFGEATDYQNWGKYPFVIANGCYSGDFANSNTHGERFVKEPGRGGIGFMSSSSEGYLHPLGTYTNLFYEVAFDDSVGAAIGRIHKETIRRFSPNGQTSISNYLNHARQINLQCDPSLALYSPKLPDLALTSPGIEFNPVNPSTADNVIKFKIRIFNYGLKNRKPFALGLRRYVQTTGEVFNHPVAVYPPFSSTDTVVDYEINFFGYGSRGLNRFEFKVDFNDEIVELREDNNTVVIEKIIRSQYPAIIYPWPFAVINKNQISLIASTYEVVRSDEPIYYYFEIDTSHKFDSPMFRQSGAVVGTSIEGKWPLPFTLTDSTVYYWRVKISSASGGESLWENASFQFVVGPHEGWAQARPPQFFDDPTQNIRMDRNRMRWEFEDLKGEVSLSIGNQSGI
ncbi:MAG: C25 family cysteine peptidase, partial [Bacteroidia bacterium]|nr:C25 family cysteine peptidase [Bacteroidia bacterium]